MVARSLQSTPRDRPHGPVASREKFGGFAEDVPRAWPRWPGGLPKPRVSWQTDALAKAYSSGKRDREARRDQRNQEKQARLQKNRDLRARGIDPMIGEAPVREAEVNIDDISPSGTAPRTGARRSMPMRLFVGGLSWDTTDADLRKAFETIGEVSEAVVILDRATGRSRGFGFVTYADAADGQRATRELHGSELDGRAIKVSTAESR